MLIAVMLLMAVSCGLREIGGQVSDAYEEVWKGPGADVKPGGGGVSKKPIWYVTGFDYPMGYDWMTDPEAGTVKCSLVVYANAVPMLKVPVGKEYLVSSDPDMHRMIGGDLYTDYSTDSLTVVKKNGKQIFSYSGREMIISMHVDSTGVYTLGESRSGYGLTFRRNGELLYRNIGGRVMGQLLGSGRAFAFSERVLGLETVVERYYLYDDGKVLQIGARDDVTKIWDVIISNGKVHYLATMTGINYPVHVSDEGMYMLEFPSKSKAWTCRFLSAGEEIVIEGLYESLVGFMVSCLWRNDTVVTTYPSGMTLWVPYVGQGGVSGILVDRLTGEQKICRLGEMHDMPEGYTVMGAAPLAMVDGILHVGMTSIDGGSPAVWQDGEIRKLGFNGYISSISVWIP